MIKFGSCSEQIQQKIIKLSGIQDLFVKRHCQNSTEYITYSALIANKCPPRLVPEEHQLLFGVCQTLISRVYGEKSVTLLTAGFVESPVNCKLQEWHYDFGGNTENIFVPLRPATSLNATEYVEWVRPGIELEMQQKLLPVIGEKRYLNLKEVNIEEPYRIRRAVANPFEILRMPSHLLHRGTINRELYPRKVFYIATTLVPGFDLEPENKLPVTSWDPKSEEAE